MNAGARSAAPGKAGEDTREERREESRQDNRDGADRGRVADVLLAEPRGFCAGVDRAIEIVERALKKFGAPIYVRHEIVHNTYVVEDLKAKGAIFIEDLAQVPRGATLVFSAHGVSQAVRQEAAERGFTVFDATCPLVSKVHVEVAKLHKEGYEFVMIGHKGHPEVEGTMGQLAEGIYLVETVADVARVAVTRPDRLAVVTQTTLSVDDAAGILAAVKQRRMRDEQLQLCYNGDAFRRVLALPASDQQKALAALALTRHDCVAPALTPTERLAVDHWRAEVLDRVETTRLPEVLKNRLHLRRAGVWASLAWQRARRSEAGAGPVTAAGKRAVDELAAINRSELAETDAATYSDAAIRVGASRWAAEPAGAVLAATAPGSLGIATSPGQPGETCVHLVDSRHDARHSLLTRCTYGIVWTASAAAHPQGTALALAVQPLDGWREMWVFRQEATGWKVDVVPPATVQPTLGYVEFAGWVPGSGQMLTAREAKVDGRYKLSFELLNPSTLEIDRWADKPASLSAFQRWQAPAWKARTVSIR